MCATPIALDSCQATRVSLPAMNAPCNRMTSSFSGEKLVSNHTRVCVKSDGTRKLLVCVSGTKEGAGFGESRAGPRQPLPRGNKNEKRKGASKSRGRGFIAKWTSHGSRKSDEHDSGTGIPESMASRGSGDEVTAGYLDADDSLPTGVNLSAHSNEAAMSLEKEQRSVERLKALAAEFLRTGVLDPEWQVMDERGQAGGALEHQALQFASSLASPVQGGLETQVQYELSKGDGGQRSVANSRLDESENELPDWQRRELQVEAQHEAVLLRARMLRKTLAADPDTGTPTQSSNAGIDLSSSASGTCINGRKGLTKRWDASGWSSDILSEEEDPMAEDSELWLQELKTAAARGLNHEEFSSRKVVVEEKKQLSREAEMLLYPAFAALAEFDLSFDGMEEEVDVPPMYPYFVNDEEEDVGNVGGVPAAAAAAVAASAAARGAAETVLSMGLSRDGRNRRQHANEVRGDEVVNLVGGGGGRRGGGLIPGHALKGGAEGPSQTQEGEDEWRRMAAYGNIRAGEEPEEENVAQLLAEASEVLLRDALSKRQEMMIAEREREWESRHQEGFETATGEELRKIKEALGTRDADLLSLGQELRETKAQLSILRAKTAAELTIAKQAAAEKEAEITAVRKTLGVLKKITVQYWGCGQHVQLAGSFNGWHGQVEMVPDLTSHIPGENGARGEMIWEAPLWLYPGQYEIKFIVDGKWTLDSRREVVVKNSAHNNLLIVDENEESEPLI